MLLEHRTGSKKAKMMILGKDRIITSDEPSKLPTRQNKEV